MGYRYSREELRRIEALVEEGLTNREIAERLGRSEAGIRNLRYRKGLIKKAEDEMKTYFQRRDKLLRSVNTLEVKQKELQLTVQDLERKRKRVERILQLDENQLQWILWQDLVKLKQEKPELFTLSGLEQLAMILRALSGK